MELALRSDESEEDMTAALTAPRPMKETKGGVRCCSTIGSTSDWWSLSRGSGPLYSVSFQASFSVTANKDASELNDVSVGDRVEPAEKRVEEGNRRGENDGGVVVHIDDDADGGAQSGENGRRPEDLTAKGGQKEQSAHPRAQRLLKWVQHCDVALFAHLRCKEEAANDETERIAKGRLAPDDARGVDHLGGAVDVPAAYPSSCKGKLSHCENAHKEAYVSTC
ncbi:hypothetical protein TYRP_001971 [Tyrophagus putrescentiae]|nr:hypothetical protein TYRP_001971 [Tyrophagus putrescentiae]